MKLSMDLLITVSNKLTAIFKDTSSMAIQKILSSYSAWKI